MAMFLIHSVVYIFLGYFISLDHLEMSVTLIMEIKFEQLNFFSRDTGIISYKIFQRFITIILINSKV